ncbi:Hypothetical protein CINCED_3A021120 [Cinara cedri]|uniref:Uncharacterized protein n=1 Tax=Cinara cedri TaxID=506608 RepID=A0A5E4MQ50_9HEMI|nr:Hypothetical protein CINCED_3A021120 [Cinara cedri]
MDQSNRKVLNKSHREESIVSAINVKKFHSKHSFNSKRKLKYNSPKVVYNEQIIQSTDFSGPTNQNMNNLNVLTQRSEKNLLLDSCPTLRYGVVCGGMLREYKKNNGKRDSNGELLKTTYLRCQKKGCQTYHSLRKKISNTSSDKVTKKMYQVNYSANQKKDENRKAVHSDIDTNRLSPFEVHSNTNRIKRTSAVDKRTIVNSEIFQTKCKLKYMQKNLVNCEPHILQIKDQCSDIYYKIEIKCLNENNEQIQNIEEAMNIEETETSFIIHISSAQKQILNSGGSILVKKGIFPIGIKLTKIIDQPNKKVSYKNYKNETISSVSDVKKRFNVELNVEAKKEMDIQSSLIPIKLDDLAINNFYQLANSASRDYLLKKVLNDVVDNDVYVNMTRLSSIEVQIHALTKRMEKERGDNCEPYILHNKDHTGDVYYTMEYIHENNEWIHNIEEVMNVEETDTSFMIHLSSSQKQILNSGGSIMVKKGKLPIGVKFTKINKQVNQEVSNKNHTEEISHSVINVKQLCSVELKSHRHFEAKNGINIQSTCISKQLDDLVIKKIDQLNSTNQDLSRKVNRKAVHNDIYMNMNKLPIEVHSNILNNLSSTVDKTEQMFNISPQGLAGGSNTTKVYGIIDSLPSSAPKSMIQVSNSLLRIEKIKTDTSEENEKFSDNGFENINSYKD